MSCTAFTPAVAVKPSLSKGLAVTILMVAPMPPVAILALPVLYTSTALTASEAKFWKSNERVLPPRVVPSAPEPAP